MYLFTYLFTYLLTWLSATSPARAVEQFLALNRFSKYIFEWTTAKIAPVQEPFCYKVWVLWRTLQSDTSCTLWETCWCCQIGVFICVRIFCLNIPGSSPPLPFPWKCSPLSHLSLYTIPLLHLQLSVTCYFNLDNKDGTFHILGSPCTKHIGTNNKCMLNEKMNLVPMKYSLYNPVVGRGTVMVKGFIK